MSPTNPERRSTPRIDAASAASPSAPAAETGSSNPAAVDVPDTPPKRRRRRKCPKPTPANRPRRISKKAANGGRCDYIDPDGNHCSHWQAPGSDACWCHFDAYMERFDFEMPHPRSKQTRSGGWKKKPPIVAVDMIPNELGKPPEWYQRP